MIKEYDSTYQIEWDLFIENSINGNFLHKQSYIKYHQHYKKNFNDKSLIIFDENKNILALFIAAESLEDQRTVVSHPGLTFGGLIYNREVYGNKVIDIFKEIINFYKKKNYYKIIYKPAPFIYHNTISQDDIFAISFLGGKKIQTDLSVTIDLRSEFVMSKRRLRHIKNINKNEITMSGDIKFIDDFWAILESNLKNKYKTKPVHSVDEIKFLIKNNSNNIESFFAIYNNQVIGGLIMYCSSKTYHIQYIAANDEGKKLFSNEFLIHQTILIAQNKKIHFYDFGISTEKLGSYLNADLYKFKYEFGGAGIVYEKYEIKI
jgi:lipid II:glycine glycyltransferase (peptidoglycan interpeptide bridge formation enzyme)